MCLIQNELKYTGNKKITCYKVLDSDLSSPYQGFQYVLNHKYDTLFDFYSTVFSTISKKINLHTHLSIAKFSFSLESFLNNLRASISYYRKKDYQVVTNGFHSFKDLRSAKILKKELNYYNDGRNYIIVKCVIPEYTWYYKGYCGFGYSNDISYASESIILEEIFEL